MIATVPPGELGGMPVPASKPVVPLPVFSYCWAGPEAGGVDVGSGWKWVGEAATVLWLVEQVLVQE